MLSISLSVFEIAILFISAVVVGIVIHLFYSGRRSINKDLQDGRKSLSSGLDEWKLKYLNEAEIKDKEITDLKNRLLDATENSRSLAGINPVSLMPSMTVTDRTSGAENAVEVATSNR